MQFLIKPNFDIYILRIINFWSSSSWTHFHSPLLSAFHKFILLLVFQKVKPKMYNIFVFVKKSIGDICRSVKKIYSSIFAFLLHLYMCFRSETQQVKFLHSLKNQPATFGARLIGRLNLALSYSFCFVSFIL